MVQDSVLHWAAHAESEGLRGRPDSTMQGRYILQSSFETSRHSPRLADIVVQLDEKIISRSVDTNSGVAFLRGKKKTGRCSRTH